MFQPRLPTPCPKMMICQDVLIPSVLVKALSLEWGVLVCHFLTMHQEV